MLTWSGSVPAAGCEAAVRGGGIITGTGAAATPGSAPGTAACRALGVACAASDGPRLGIDADTDGPKRSAAQAARGGVDACFCTLLSSGRRGCAGGTTGGVADGRALMPSDACLARLAGYHGALMDCLERRTAC